ncbi:uncharacterized protein LOC126378855 isoform X2 [Pectinophora gossypiella]|uniref:uncharacterized protein LOC126378855 isoform X2 n=1 Tax=Pectinophora gossypiella TaxID=13191 RepID=UPI00214E10AE|nr:uncharacterized protein LOC126378855 isoform X2 [Pectinophora gossypiella]
MKMMPQQYCLRWKHHHTNVQNMFAQLLEKERFCDVTLYCSPSFATQVPDKNTVDSQNIRGVSLRAHRVVLAACSELLGALLGAHDALGEPVLVIDGAEPKHLRALLDYMYTGEMSVHHSQLASLLKTAEELRIKGLTDIRWNNKDEPPDCPAGGIITTTSGKRTPERKSPEPKHAESKHAEPKHAEPKHDPKHESSPMENMCPELRAYMKKDDSDSDSRQEKFNVNGGPPPLIKLPTKEKTSPIKRENSDTDTPSPKRQRLASGPENTDEESYQSKAERDQEWQHGNLDISAERVVGWGMTGMGWSRDGSDDEWGDAPADIGSFLHTRLRVDGDNSADEESTEESSNPGPASTSAPSTITGCAGIAPSDIKIDLIHAPLLGKSTSTKPTQLDPRFTDVVKLNDYLQHGRRPQFWEENYVRRVMEAVRLKELEMKQAAEILGVSYGTLYGRYRDVYGCINRPYSVSTKKIFDRTARDFWQAKGPSEVLERLQRGEVSVEAASQALGVTPTTLAAYVADVGATEKDFEPIPIEIDPSLKMKSPRPFPKPRYKTPTAGDKPVRKVVVGSLEDEDIPAAVIAAHDALAQPAHSPAAAAAAAATMSGKWPTIRVAQLDTLRSDPAPTPPTTAPTSPSQLMRTRPDLTIVAARRDKRDDDHA